MDVVVTGASTGIGQACALHLHRAGWRVFAGVRREEDAERLRAQAGERLVPLTLDVTVEDSVRTAVERVRGELGPGGLSGLVNNAGVAVAGPFEFVPLEEWRRQLEVNVIGVVSVTQAFLPLLRRGQGPDRQHGLDRRSQLHAVRRALCRLEVRAGGHHRRAAPRAAQMGHVGGHHRAGQHRHPDLGQGPPRCRGADRSAVTRGARALRLRHGRRAGGDDEHRRTRAGAGEGGRGGVPRPDRGPSAGRDTRSAGSPDCACWPRPCCPRAPSTR